MRVPTIHAFYFRIFGERLNNKGYLVFFFSVKDRNLFHRKDTIGNIFTSAAATSENITDGVHEMKQILIFHRKKRILFISCF